MEFSIGRMPYDELVKKVRELIAKNLSGKDDDNGGGGIDESQIVTSLDETSNTKVLSAATGQLIKDAINAKLDRIRPNVQFVQMPQELSADYLDVVVGSKIYVPFVEFPQLVGSEVGDLKIVRVAVEDYAGDIFELAYTYYVYLFGNVTSVDDNGINVLVEWTYRETNEGVNPGINEDAVKQLINSAIEEATRFFITYDDIAGMLSNYAIPDTTTLIRNDEGLASVTGIYTINSTIPGTPPLRFFVGTRAEFAAIADTNNVFAIITDDPNVDAYNALVEAVDVLEGLYANHEARIDNLEGLYANHEARIDNLEGLYANHEARIVDLETLTSNHETRITDIESIEIPRLDGRCALIEYDVHDLKGAVGELQDDVKVLQTKVKDLQEDVETLQDDVVRIDENIEAINKDLTETKEKVADNSKEIVFIKDGTTIVEKALRDAKGNIIDETYVRKDEITDLKITRVTLTDKSTSFNSPVSTVTLSNVPFGNRAIGISASIGVRLGNILTAAEVNFSTFFGNAQTPSLVGGALVSVPGRCVIGAGGKAVGVSFTMAVGISQYDITFENVSIYTADEGYSGLEVYRINKAVIYYG